MHYVRLTTVRKIFSFHPKHLLRKIVKPILQYLTVCNLLEHNCTATVVVFMHKPAIHECSCVERPGKTMLESIKAIDVTLSSIFIISRHAFFSIQFRLSQYALNVSISSNKAKNILLSNAETGSKNSMW